MKLESSYFRLVLALIASLALSQFAKASSVIPLSTADQVAAAGAIFRGVVVGTDCYRDATDGLIYTRTSLRVIESLKGTLPTIVAVVHPGGTVDGTTSYNSWSPRMNHGDVRLMFVTRRSDGRLTLTQGAASALKLAAQNESAAPTQEALLAEIRSLTSQSTGDDFTDQSGFVTSALTTGLTDRGGGIPARFVQADAGEPIPYLIDADHLPAGITLAQATNAVAQAMNAWSAVTSLKFKSEGVQSFGTNANAINPNDGKLYIQLHDDYNTINSASTLGIGGSYTSSQLIGNPGWGAGGNVAGNEFFRSSSGNVVLERTNATMQNLATFTEVLCHEIGHAIGMAHSSETLSEPNNTLKQSIMYYLVHADGRGAALGTYDPPVIQQAYPTNNTPPYSYGRMMYVTTSSAGAPNVPGINELEIRGYDLQGTALTLQTNGATANTGAFSRSGNFMKFTPSANYLTDLLDPASGSYYDRIYARFSDGTNASASAEVRVLSHSTDSFPTVRDGIPNNWMTTYFGNSNPTAGPNRGATQDWDGDGLTNIDEYRSGMNPTNATSAQRITFFTKESLQFQAKAYELYELHASTNLTTWFRAANPLIPTTATGTFTDFTNSAPHLFFRVLKVP